MTVRRYPDILPQLSHLPALVQPGADHEMWILLVPNIRETPCYRKQKDVGRLLQVLGSVSPPLTVHYLVADMRWPWVQEWLPGIVGKQDPHLVQTFTTTAGGLLAPPNLYSYRAGLKALTNRLPERWVRI